MRWRYKLLFINKDKDKTRNCHSLADQTVQDVGRLENTNLNNELDSSRRIRMYRISVKYNLVTSFLELYKQKGSSGKQGLKNSYGMSHV